MRKFYGFISIIIYTALCFSMYLQIEPLVNIGKFIVPLLAFILCMAGIGILIGDDEKFKKYIEDRDKHKVSKIFEIISNILIVSCILALAAGKFYISAFLVTAFCIILIMMNGREKELKNK